MHFQTSKLDNGVREVCQEKDMNKSKKMFESETKIACIQKSPLPEDKKKKKNSNLKDFYMQSHARPNK